MSEELKPCPCGVIPDKLIIEEGSLYRYAIASGNCCNEWLLEFKILRYDICHVEVMNLAIKAWNSMPRGGMK